MVDNKQKGLPPKMIYVYGGIVLLLGLIVLVTVAFLKQGSTVFNFQKPYQCTLEVRMCDDGTAVVRSGPKCEFAACPAFPAGVSVIIKASGTSSDRTTFTTFTAFNDKDMKELQKNITGSSDELAVYPAVDFSKEFVFGAKLGLRNSGGYSITVKSVEETDTKIAIVFQETTPGKGCMVTEALTTPYVIARKNTPASVAAQKEIDMSFVTVEGVSCSSNVL